RPKPSLFRIVASAQDHFPSRWLIFKCRLVEASSQTLFSSQAFGPGPPKPDLTAQVYPPNSISLAWADKPNARNRPASRNIAFRFIAFVSILRLPYNFDANTSSPTCDTLRS